jgi:hypothetical protein
MEHFAGLDVSVKETSVCIVDDVGKIVREVKVASEPFGSSRTKFPVTWSQNTSIGQSIFVHSFLSSMSLSSVSERRQSAQPMSVHDVWLVTRAARSPFAVVQFLAPMMRARYSPKMKRPRRTAGPNLETRWRQQALFLRRCHSASATRVPSARRGPCRASTLGHRLLATSVWFRFLRGGTAFLAFAHCALWTRGRRLRLRES